MLTISNFLLANKAIQISETIADILFKILVSDPVNQNPGFTPDYCKISQLFYQDVRCGCNFCDLDRWKFLRLQYLFSDVIVNYDITDAF